MSGIHSFIYALRGWLAFVAFMDIGTAIRCFDHDFLLDKVYSAGYNEALHPAMARLFALWSILNAVIMLHCALCIHHAPILVLSLCSLALSIFVYVLETFWYGTMTVGLAVFFPVAVNGSTIVLLVFAPHYLWSPEILLAQESIDEEEEILKKGFPLPPPPPTRKQRKRRQK